LNMEVRKYLKKVGVTSQREIEHAVLKPTFRTPLIHFWYFI